jgi:tRNA/tmRNA/rRNA uracil-C5-methylase (TrmA/RlmC/RlmD family)
MAGTEREVVIEALGARGDGVTRLDAARIFVPFTLPGDRLRVRISGQRGDGLVGEPVEWLEQAPRAEPPCPHFGAWCTRSPAPAGAPGSRSSARARRFASASGNGPDIG